MDALKLVPQLFFDLIARVVPGVVLLVLFSLITPGMSWETTLNLAAGGKLDKGNAFAFSLFLPLALGYVLGHLIAPLGKLLGRATTANEPWERYDYLRVHLPDIGALTAKIRAEYTMHFSLAAAFLLGTVGLIVRLL